MGGQSFLTAISARPGDRDLTLDHEKDIGAASAWRNKVWPGRISSSAPYTATRVSTPLEVSGNLGGAGLRVSAESFSFMAKLAVKRVLGSFW